MKVKTIAFLLMFFMLSLAGLYGCGKTANQPESHCLTISFNSNGGEEIDSMVDVVSVEPEVSRDGYIFDGWYLDGEFTESVTFPFYAQADITLYAKWTTPMEKYLKNDGEYTYNAELWRYEGTTLGRFKFKYDKTSEKVIVSGSTVSPFYPTAKIEYEFPLSNVSLGRGSFVSAGFEYPMTISKVSDGKVKVEVTGTIKYFDSEFPYTMGSSIVTISCVSEFYHEIDNAFSAYYSYCIDNFSLSVY